MSFQICKKQWLLVLVLWGLVVVNGFAIDNVTAAKKMMVADSLLRSVGASNTINVTDNTLAGIYKTICENNKESFIDRIYDYEEMELVDLLKTAITDSLSNEELIIMTSFINEYRISGQRIGETSLIKVSIDSYLKEHPNKLFMQRLSLYCLKKNLQNKQFMDALEQMLLTHKDLPSINLLMAKVAFVKGDFETAINYCGLVLRDVPKSAFSYNYRSLAYFKSDNKLAALVDLDSAIALYPKFPDAYNNMGNIYLSDLKLGEAESAYRKAIELKSTYDWPYFNLGLVYAYRNNLDGASANFNRAHVLSPDNLHFSSKIADFYYNLNRLDSAYKYFNICIENDSENPFFYAQRGNVSYDIGKIEGALKDFEYAFSLNGKYVYSLKRQSDCYVKLGDYKSAFLKLNEAVDIDQDYAYGYNALGHLYSDVNNYASSLANYKKAIKLMPKEAIYYCDKGDLYYATKQYPQALADYNKAIELNPKSRLYYAYRGNTYFELNNLDMALADYKMAVEVDSSFAYSIARCGDVYLERKDSVSAEKMYRRALAADSLNIYGYKRLSKLYSERGFVDEALLVLDKILVHYPQNAALFSERGFANRQAKRYDAAVADFSTCIKLQPKTVYYLAYRANSYFSNKNSKEAIADLKLALELDPTYTYANWRLGDFYTNENEYKTAIDWYNKALVVDPKNISALHGKSTCCTHLKLYRDAELLLKEVLDIDDNDDTAYGNLGWINYCKGNFEKCIEFSNRAIKLNESAYYAMFNIALSTLRMGKFEESKTLYTNYVKLCNDRKVKIRDGAIRDLQDLIDGNVLVDQSNYIIKNIFDNSKVE